MPGSPLSLAPSVHSSGCRSSISIASGGRTGTMSFGVGTRLENERCREASITISNSALSRPTNGSWMEVSTVSPSALLERTSPCLSTFRYFYALGASTDGPASCVLTTRLTWKSSGARCSCYSSGSSGRTHVSGVTGLRNRSPTPRASTSSTSGRGGTWRRTSALRDTDGEALAVPPKHRWSAASPGARLHSRRTTTRSDHPLSSGARAGEPATSGALDRPVSMSDHPGGFDLGNAMPSR